jgi:hypothetical protein
MGGGDRAVRYGQDAAEKTERRALAYGERAIDAPSSKGGSAASDQPDRVRADPQALPAPPPEAEGLHDAQTLAAVNALSLDPLGLEALSRVQIRGQTLVPPRVGRAFRAITLARIIHALGEPDLDPMDVPIVAQFMRASEQPPEPPVPVQWLLRALSSEPPPRARVPGEDRLLPYDPELPFELIRQLAAAAQAAPGTRWDVGWWRMTDAFELLFGPDPAGPRLLGGRVNRPGDDLLSIVARFRASVGRPGVARGRGAVLSAFRSGGIIVALQGLPNIMAAIEGGQRRTVTTAHIPNSRNVIAHGESYIDDLQELAS